MSLTWALTSTRSALIPSSLAEVDLITTRRSAWSPLSSATLAFWALILAAIAFCLASASESSSPVATWGAPSEPLRSGTRTAAIRPIRAAVAGGAGVRGAPASSRGARTRWDAGRARWGSDDHRGDVTLRANSVARARLRRDWRLRPPVRAVPEGTPRDDSGSGHHTPRRPERPRRAMVPRRVGRRSRAPPDKPKVPAPTLTDPVPRLGSRPEDGSAELRRRTNAAEVQPGSPGGRRSPPGARTTRRSGGRVRCAGRSPTARRG